LQSGGEKISHNSDIEIDELFRGVKPLNRIVSTLTTYIYMIEFTESIKCLCYSDLGNYIQKRGVNP
jgi:hypothetical protein